jgi:hypothetical protein
MAVLQSDGVNHTSDLILRRNGTEGLRLTSSTVQLSSINNGQLAGFRNRIINGAMEISQRGPTFVAPAGYTLDRFVFSTAGPTGGGVATVTRSTDAPNNTFQYSLKVDVTTADTSIAAGDFSHIVQRIEGYNVRDLIGQTFTLSFWVKSPKTGVHCVSFRNSIFDRTHVLEYTVSTANTWEYKSVTVTGGLITAGTWNWTNGIGVDVVFTLLAGTVFQTTTGSWQTGNFIGTSNQVNVMDNTANNFFLTGVQLEAGPVATPFERRPIGAELVLCQRYFEKSSGNVAFGTMAGSTSAFRQIIYCFKVEKRATPSVTTTFNSGTTGVQNITTTSAEVFSNVGNAGDTALCTSVVASAEL